MSDWTVEYWTVDTLQRLNDQQQKAVAAALAPANPLFTACPLACHA